MGQQSVHADRITRITAELSASGAAAAIAFSGADLHYLLGTPLSTHERFTGLVLTPTPLDDDSSAETSSSAEATLVVPELEATTDVFERAAAAGVSVCTWRDGDDPLARVSELLAQGTRIPDGTLPVAGEVLVSAEAPARHIVPLQDRLGERVALLAPVIDRLRSTKTSTEVEELAQAAAAIDRVHARMGELLTVGRTERQVAAAIEQAIVEEGLTHAEFIIVGSGPNGADPHHEVSDRKIDDGDIVVVDIGGPLPSGYHSDCTRSYAMGKPASDIAADYAVLERAQAAARDAVRPGVRASDIDAAAREVLRSAGLAELFVHRTGHGIGMSVHEAPYIAADSDTLLEAGMAFSIEPGIYRTGEWGARLEDIVVVTADGCRVLNNQPRGLTVL